MMKRKKRVEIVVETEKRFTIRRPGSAPATRCGRCSGPLIPVEQVVLLTGLSSRAIHRAAEAGEVHFAETAAGTLLICLNSLQEWHG